MGEKLGDHASHLSRLFINTERKLQQDSKVTEAGPRVHKAHCDMVYYSTTRLHVYVDHFHAPVSQDECEYGQYRETDNTMVIRDRLHTCIVVGFLSRLSDKPR
jgi:hypothetical protein